MIHQARTRRLNVAMAAALRPKMRLALHDLADDGGDRQQHDHDASSASPDQSCAGCDAVRSRTVHGVVILRSSYQFL